MLTIFKRFNNKKNFVTSFSLSQSGLYKIPLEPTKEESLRYITTLPLTPLPEVFGLHENADISKNNQETDLVIPYSHF